MTNDYSIDLNISVDDRGSSPVLLRLGGEFVEIPNQFVGIRASLTTGELDGLNDQPLSDGDHRFELRLGDSDSLLDFVISIDTTGPTLDSIGLTRESDSGNLNDELTIHQQVDLWGLTDPNLFIQISESGIPANSRAESDATDIVAFNDLALALGENEFQFSATDLAGNHLTVSKRIERISENQPPTIDQIEAIDLTVGDYLSKSVRRGIRQHPLRHLD